MDMACEVKAAAYTYRRYPDRTAYTFNPEQLKAFEALVRADERSVEREACAKVCDVLSADYGKAGLPMTFQALSATATEIRARGQRSDEASKRGETK